MFYIPVKEYAAKYKLTVQAVYKRIKTGKLKMMKIGTYTLVKDK
jgi:hypothetical protein